MCFYPMSIIVGISTRLLRLLTRLVVLIFYFLPCLLDNCSFQSYCDGKASAVILSNLLDSIQIFGFSLSHTSVVINETWNPDKSSALPHALPSSEIRTGWEISTESEKITFKWFCLSPLIFSLGDKIILQGKKCFVVVLCFVLWSKNPRYKLWFRGVT